MKILMISRKFGDLGDTKASYGPYAFISRLVTELSKYHDLYVVTSGSKVFTQIKSSRIKIIEVPSFPKDPFKITHLPRYINKNLIKKINPDVIHSQDIDGALLFKSYRGKTPKVLSMKSDILGVESKRKTPAKVKDKIGRRISLFIEKAAIKNSNYIIAPSNYLKEEIIKYYGVEKDKISVIYNGTDIRVFHPNIEISRLVKKLKPNGENLILSTSHGKRKGLDIMLKSFNLIKKNIPQSKLILAGVSDIEKFKAFIDTEIVSVKNDIVLLGKIPNEEMPKYYNLCDVFALPTFHETFGNVFAEAMACEKPVVSFDATAMPEIVAGGGILTKPGDVEAFSKSIITLLKNKTKSHNLGRAGRSRVANNFTIERSVEEHLKFYKKITESHEI